MDTPELWWSSIRFKKCYIRDLALRLFGITPSQASCERNFSILKWMIGDRHTRLNVKKLEDMSKICSYYLTSIKNELKYYGKELNSNDLREIANDSAVGEIITLNSEDDTTNNLLLEERRKEEIQLRNNLVLEDIIDLTQLFDNVEIDLENNNTLDEENENMDFDPINLVNQILNDINT